jgi:hypothetical protein
MRASYALKRIATGLSIPRQGQTRFRGRDLAIREHAMQISGNQLVAAAYVGAAGAGVAGGIAATTGRDPWTWDYPGPGSAEQVPSMFVPWMLPGTAGLMGAAWLHGSGHRGAATAVGLMSTALTTAGFTTWAAGKSN